MVWGLAVQQTPATELGIQHVGMGKWWEKVESGTGKHRERQHRKLFHAGWQTLSMALSYLKFH